MTPTTRAVLRKADRTLEGYNPLCGDHFTIYLKVENDVVKDVSFQGKGCEISTASASLMMASYAEAGVAPSSRLWLNP